MKIIHLLTCVGLAQAIRQGGLSQSMTDALLPYNAIYNGTLTVIMTASNSPSCNLAEGNIPGYYLELGPMVAYDNSTINRSDYDTNPFYFHLDGPSIPSGTWLELASSYDTYNSGSTYWNMSITKNGDGFDVTGTHILYSYENGFGLNTCNVNIIRDFIQVKNGWTMKGHISSTAANLTWGPAPWTAGGSDFTRWWTFTGNLDTSGPKVDVSGTQIKVTGKSKYATKSTSSAASSTASASSKNLGPRTIEASWGLLGLGLVAVIL
jgi:hypothetical protein